MFCNIVCSIKRTVVEGFSFVFVGMSLRSRALALYRYGNREIRHKLEDGGARAYYRRHLRAQFVAHRDSDNERAEELLVRGRHDIAWVISQRGTKKN